MITPKLNTIFIFLLVFTLIGGSYLVMGHVGGVEISAYRFVLVITAAYLLFTRQLVFYTNRFSKFVFYFFLIWFLYGLVSLTWAPDILYGIKELFYLGIGTLTYFIFLTFSHVKKDFINIIERVLVISFLIVTGLFVFEMITQQHLVGEYTDKLALLGDFHRSNIIPIFTFVNPNVGAIYLCICIVFSTWFFFCNKNRMLHVTIVLIAFHFLLLMESRLGVFSVLAMAVMTIILLFFRKKRSLFSWSFSKPHLLAIFLLIGLSLVVFYSEWNFLKSEPNALEMNNSCKHYSEIGHKIDKRIEQSGRILLTSDAGLVEKPDSSYLKSDKVFVIENKTYLKLLNNESVELQFKKVNRELYKKMFIGKNELLLVLSMTLLFLILITVFIYTNRFTKNKRMLFLPLTGVVIVILLAWNSYQFPSQGYKKRVLVEKGLVMNHLQKKDLSVVSTDFQTGKVLQTGKSLRTYLFDKKKDMTLDSNDSKELGSNGIRKNLILNGLDYLKKSNYLGIGAGGFLASNLNKQNKYPDGGVGGAHNFIIEILSQYGVGIFALLAGVFFWILLILIRSFFKGIWNEKHFLVLWLLIVLIFMGNANSTFLSLPMNWLLVAFLLVFANKLMPEKVEQNEIKN